MKNCPCGTNKPYLACCGLYISGTQNAPTPETLMRSRYTAYTEGNIDYIEKTMRGAALEGFDKKSAQDWALQMKWLGLNVITATQDGASGTVEFMASYSHNNQQVNMHERSSFQCDQGLWYYTDGVSLENHARNKVGRNELCPCGSHKKFKKCCGA